MQTFLQILVITAVLLGTFFSFVGVLGYYRLPDVYTKLHAAGKVGVFGDGLADEVCGVGYVAVGITGRAHLHQSGAECGRSRTLGHRRFLMSRWCTVLRPSRR